LNKNKNEDHTDVPIPEEKDFNTKVLESRKAVNTELRNIAINKNYGKEILVRATNVEGTDNLGGYLVPTEKGEFLFTINQYGLVRDNGTIITMNREKQDMPYPATDLEAYNVAESGTGTASNYVFGNLQLDATKYIGLAPISSELLEDTFYPLDQIVGASLVSQFAGAEDALFNTRINSVGNSYGTTGSATGTFANTITGADQFVSEVLSPIEAGLASVNTKYTEGAGFVMNPTTWFTILKWSDTTRRPIANFIDAVNMTLWGQSVYLSNKFTTATTVTSGKVIIAYGNLKNAFLGDRKRMEIKLFDQGSFSTTNAMESDLIVFRGRARFDVELKPDAFWVYRLK
jgi:HK97 family phage major capsid protein